MITQIIFRAFYFSHILLNPSTIGPFLALQAMRSSCPSSKLNDACAPFRCKAVYRPCGKSYGSFTPDAKAQSWRPGTPSLTAGAPRKSRHEAGIRFVAMDQIAGDGTLFTNAHAPAPPCRASRSSKLTGVSPARSRVVSNESRPMRDSIPGRPAS